jgi:Malectin domain/Right handed beta helix region
VRHDSRESALRSLAGWADLIRKEAKLQPSSGPPNRPLRISKHRGNPDVFRSTFRLRQQVASRAHPLSGSRRPLVSAVTASLLLVVALLAAHVVSPRLLAFQSSSSEGWTLRINSGGPAFTDSLGRSWVADTDFGGGATTSRSNHIADALVPGVGAVSGAGDQSMYDTERWGMNSYTIPVPATGTYLVRLHEAETYFSAPCAGQRVFSVAAHGATIIANLDICAAVGPNRAYVLDSQVPVTDGNIDLAFSATANAPKVSGIEVTLVSTAVPPTPAPTATPTPGCSGPPLTSQSQVQPNASYCGGVVTGQIVLADGDSWTGGDVSGAVTGQQDGAVRCGNPCWLTNMNIHDNPNAFAGIYPTGSGTGPMTITGGRVTGSGSLGIGGGGVGQLTISGVEIDHNGATASCGFEGGGFKGINQGSRFTNNYVHDNNCFGVWYDINAASNEIDHNRVDNNSSGGIFYEIGQDASIHDNEASGNGGGACSWLWGAGIGIASSFNVQVYNNTVANNCNGIGETQQTRTDSTPPAHLLQNVDVHNNSISGAGMTGAVADNGADLTTRNLTWENNTFTNGAIFWG